MESSHKYNIEHWTNYYQGKIDKQTHIDMTLHLADCDECLDYYTQCAEANISLAPVHVKKEIMKRVRKPFNTKQIMIAYATAACIATGLYSFGWIDKTIDYAPEGIERSFNAIDLVSKNVNQITNKIIWRGFNGKEE